MYKRAARAKTNLDHKTTVTLAALRVKNNRNYNQEPGMLFTNISNIYQSNSKEQLNQCINIKKHKQNYNKSIYSTFLL